MEEGNFSGSEPSEVTDGQNTNTTMTTETHTTTEHQPKPLVVRLLEVHNCDEDEEDEEEEEEEDHEAPKTHKSHEASVSFKSVSSSDSPKASDLPLSCKASDFLGSSKASDPPGSFKALQSSESQEDVKDDLFSNAVIRTSPSLMTEYPPQLQLTSQRGRFSPDPTEIQPSRTRESALNFCVLKRNLTLPAALQPPPLALQGIQREADTLIMTEATSHFRD